MDDQARNTGITEHAKAGYPEFGEHSACAHAFGDTCAACEPRKTCGKCKVEKPTTEFHKDRTAASGLYSYCKECKCAARKKQKRVLCQKDPIGQWAMRVLNGARYRDKFLVTITHEDVKLLVEDAHGLCAYCDRLLSFNTRAKKRDESSTLDRIDPRLGYNLVNTVVCCHKCNAQKNDATPEELHNMANRVTKLIEMRKKNDFSNCRDKSC